MTTVVVVSRPPTDNRAGLADGQPLLILDTDTERGRQSRYEALRVGGRDGGTAKALGPAHPGQIAIGEPGVDDLRL